MFDHEDDDRDLESQVLRGSVNHDAGIRSEREATPGPHTTHTPDETDAENPSDSPSSTTTEKSGQAAKSEKDSKAATSSGKSNDKKD